MRALNLKSIKTTCPFIVYDWKIKRVRKVFYNTSLKVPEIFIRFSRIQKWNFCKRAIFCSIKLTYSKCIFFICAFLQCSFDLTKRRVCCEGFVLKAAQLRRHWLLLFLFSSNDLECRLPWESLLRLMTRLQPCCDMMFSKIFRESAHWHVPVGFLVKGRIKLSAWLFSIIRLIDWLLCTRL